MKIMGTLGEIRGNMENIEVYSFLKQKLDVFDFGDADLGHGGGDLKLIKGFINSIKKGNRGLTSAEVTLESHLLVFAAEEARLSNSVVDFNVFLNPELSILFI